MLQTVSDANPPQIVAIARPRATAVAQGNNPLNCIHRNIMPLGPEPDLAAAIDCLVALNDINAMIALYDTYSGTARRWAEVMDDGDDIATREFNHAWSKAYLVADHLKTMMPGEFTHEIMAETLFSAALQMGSSLREAIAVAKTVAKSYESDRPMSAVAARKAVR